MGGPADTSILDRLPTRAALDQIIGFRLRRLQTLWIAHWARGIRQLGLEITPMQGGIMMLLQENSGIGHSALAGLLNVEAPTLSQSLTPLVNGGLVERVRAREDGRAVALYLSKTGEGAVAAISRFSHRHQEDLLAGLNQEERHDLVKLLDKALTSAAAVLTCEKNQGKDSAP